MKRYDLFILDSTKAIVASMQDAIWEISETLNVEDTLRAALFEADKFNLVTAENTFIRLVNASDSTDKRTYRLTSVEESRIDGRHALQCEGARIWADMGREIYVGWHPFKNIQVKTIVAELLDSSAFQIKSGGNAESDTTIIEALDFAYTTVLEGMQRIAEKADLEIEIDESTSPESIDLKTRGASNNTRFEYGINTSGMARRFRRAEVVNKVYPVGGGSPPATCKGALFEVYSISTATITVAGNKCIPSDDTYNTYKIKMVTGGDAGTSFTINDTTRGSSGDDDTIVLSTTPGSVSAGDLFMFTDASGNELDFVPDAVSQAAYGTFDGVVRDQQFEEIRTLITPGFMDGTYASGLHDGWTKTGTPTVAEETGIDYIQHGSASQHVTAASDTHGIYYDVSLDSSDYYSCAVNLNVVSGSVLVKITTTGSTGAVEYKNQGGTSGTGWLTVELEGLPIEGATAKLTIQATGGAAEFYVDAVSFTGTQQTRQFVRENGARELYRMAFDYLDENDAPMVEYDLPNALDLYAIDSTKYPFYDVSVGDTVTVIDPGMSLAASVRVLSLGYDSHGRQLRVKLSSHTSTSAAFSQVAPGIGRVIQQGRKIAQDEIDGNRTNENALSIANRLNKIAGNSARASRFTGTFTATGQTSFDVGSGTLYVGTSLAYTIGAQTISGLSGGSVYYLYFDPTSASSGLQTTTTAATAYATDNIQVGVLKTGSTSNDNVQIFDTTGAQVSGEVITRGLEAYDTGGTKRIDIGVLQDPSASIGNPGTWGIQVTDGAHQTTSLLAEYTGSIPGAMRYLYATLGDPDEDLTYATTTQKVYGDYVSMYAKSSANMIVGLFEGNLVSGSSGHLFGHEVSSLSNAGSGNATAFNIGVTQTSGGGHAYGLHVGDGLGVRSTSTGNAYGIYIAAVSSTSGSAYSIYDATTNRARFGGSISVRGVDYVWPAADGTANYVLSTDGSGNLSWVSNAGGGSVTGSGTTNYVSKWTSSSALGNSVFYDDGTNAYIKGTTLASPPTWIAIDKLILEHNGSLVQQFFFPTAEEAYIQFSNPSSRFRGGISYGGSTNASRPDALGFWTAGENLRMTIDSSGKVGIGTSSPTNALSVTKSIAGDYVAEFHQGDATVGASYGVRIQGGTNSLDDAFVVANQANSAVFLHVKGDGTVLVPTGNVGIGTASTTGRVTSQVSTYDEWAYSIKNASGTLVGGLYVNGVATKPSLLLYDETGSTVKVNLTGNAGSYILGNVGIGTSSPSAPLHVQGTGNTYAYIGTTSTTAITGVYFYENTTTLGGALQYTASDNSMLIGTVTSGNFGISTNNTTRATFDTNGRMGLATASPASTLHIYNSSAGSTVGIRLENNSGSDWGLGEIVFNNTFAIYDFGASTTRVAVQTNGDVGVGVIPDSRLHVGASYDLISNGYIARFENTNTSTATSMGMLAMEYSGAAPNSTSHVFLFCFDNSGDRAAIYSNGTFGSATNTYGSLVSDGRLKHGVENARSHWDDFQRLQWTTFYFNNNPTEKMFGLIAQNVRDVYPTCVTYNNNGFMGVKNSIIHEIGMSVLIEAQKRIETVEEKVERLESENAELTARIELLEAA